MYLEALHTLPLNALHPCLLSLERSWECSAVNLGDGKQPEALGTGHCSTASPPPQLVGIKQWTLSVSRVFHNVLNSYVFLYLGNLRKFIVTGGGTDTSR